MIKKDVENNILYVSHGYDPQSAYKEDFPLRISISREVAMQKVTFKIRHTPEYHPATIEKLEDGRWMIHSEEAIHGVAPGQFCSSLMSIIIVAMAPKARLLPTV